MADAGMSLVLGFIGEEPVHRDNARALLADLIAAYLRDNKNAKVRFILPAHPFSDTMSDLADYCMTSGYQMGLVGTSESLKSNPFTDDAVGNIYPLRDDLPLAKGMVSALSIWDDARLILIADPSTDDAAYTALVTAAGMGIKVRSLLHGLDEVLMESPEEVTPDMRVVDEEYEGDEEEPEEETEDGDEEVEVDYDALAVAADAGDEGSQVELSDAAKEAGINPDSYETWVEVADLLNQAEVEEVVAEEAEAEEEEPDVEEDDEIEVEEYFDSETEGEESDEETDDEESEEDEEESEEEDVEDLDVSDEAEDEEPEADEEKEEPVAQAKKKWTEAALIKLGERNKDAFYEACADYGVYPGRGQKVSIMARKVMDVIEGVAPTRRTQKAPAKKAAAKKAPARKTAAKKAPAKKATAKRAPARAKKAAAEKTTKRTATAKRAPRQTAAAVNGYVDKATARTFIKLATAALEIAEQLV